MFGRFENEKNEGNEKKTKLILIGSKRRLRNLKVNNNRTSINIRGTKIEFIHSVRDLGLTIDENLTLKKQVNLVVKSCNNQLRNIYFIKKYVTKTCLKMIVFNQIISRLDYCNSAYTGLPKYLLRKMQIILNKRARLVSGTTVDERITPELINLHWLPIKARINYKIFHLVHIARLS